MRMDAGAHAAAASGMRGRMRVQHANMPEAAAAACARLRGVHNGFGERCMALHACAMRACCDSRPQPAACRHGIRTMVRKDATEPESLTTADEHARLPRGATASASSAASSAAPRRAVGWGGGGRRGRRACTSEGPRAQARSKWYRRRAAARATNTQLLGCQWCGGHHVRSAHHLIAPSRPVAGRSAGLSGGAGP